MGSVPWRCRRMMLPLVPASIKRALCSSRWLSLHGAPRAARRERLQALCCAFMRHGC
jgi:hypothetical protein